MKRRGRGIEPWQGGPVRALCRCLCLAAVASFVVGCGRSEGPPNLADVRERLAPPHHLVYEGRQGSTVLELLEENAESVGTRRYGDQVLVESVNGITGGTDGRYWFYYVNGEPGLVAASQRSTRDGDRVEWVFSR